MNELVDWYRKQNPNDFLSSDDDITLGFVREHGLEKLSRWPATVADYNRILKERIGPGDYAQQAVGEAGRAFFSGIADIPESLAIGARGLNKALPISEDVPLAEMPLYRAGQAVRGFGEAVTPAPVPGLENSFWASQVPQAFGSSAQFMVGGAVGKALKIPGLLGIAGLGAMSGGVQGYKDAKEKGASDDDAFYSGFLNAVVGTSEAVPLAHILKSIDKWAGGGMKKALLESGKQGFEEALQEWFQQYAGNKIANNIVGYDKSREDFKDVLTNAEAGGVTGTVISLLASAVGARLHAMRTKDPEKVDKVDEVIPGLTTGQAVAAPPEVTIPNKDIVENYTGPLTPERQAMLSGIAQQKIETGVDLSAGLTVEDQNAVKVLETQLLKKAATEEEAANELARLQAMSTDELITQREIMVKQGFDPKQIDALDRVLEEKVKGFESQVSGLPAEGGEQVNAESQKQEAGGVPIVGQSVPAVGQAEGQAQAGTPQRTGAGEEVVRKAGTLNTFERVMLGQEHQELKRKLEARGYDTALLADKIGRLGVKIGNLDTEEVLRFQDLSDALVEDRLARSQPPPAAVEPAPVTQDIAALARARATEGLLQEEPTAPNKWGANPIWLSELSKPENADIAEIWRLYQEDKDSDARFFLSGGQRGLVETLNEVRELIRNYPTLFSKLSAKLRPAPTPAAVIPAPTPVAPSLVDQIGFDNAIFQATGETTAIGKKGGEAAILQPAYHERMESSAYTPALAEQLIQNARGEGGQSAQNTRRATAFVNSDTGQVVVLGTFKVGGKEVSVVNPDDKRGYGIPLRQFLAQKNSKRGQLWTPLASMWFPNTKNGLSEKFDDRAAYDVAIGDQAKERIAANVRGALAVQEAMQRQGITSEGDIVELAPASVEPGSPIDNAQQFNEAMTEALVDADTGKIPNDLAIEDITERLLPALSTISPEAKRYAIASVWNELFKDARFRRLNLEQQQRQLAAALALSVYEDYKKGKFEPIFQQGISGEGRPSVVRPDIVPQAGPEKLQTLAEDIAPGAPGGGGDTASGGGQGRAKPSTYQEPDDLISYIRRNIGKIRGKKLARPGTEGFYTEAYKQSLKYGAIKKLYSNQTGQSLDSVVDTLRRSGVVSEGFTVDDLHDALIRAAGQRKNKSSDTARESKVIEGLQEQTEDFIGVALKRKTGGEPINVNDLFEGDTFELKGEKVRVKELRLDPETGDLAYVVLDDGRRFGTQTVGSDTVIHPDKGTLEQKEQSTEFLPPEPAAPLPKLRRGEEQGDVFANQTEDMALVGEKGIDYEKRALEKEAAAKAISEAKEIQEKAQTNLFHPSTTPDEMRDQRQRYWVGIKRGLLEADDGSNLRLVESSVNPKRFDVWKTEDGKRTMLNDPKQSMPMQEAQRYAVDFAIKANETAAKDKGLRYSAVTDTLPWFYSRLTRTIEQSPQGKASGAQWKATIKNSKLGANADEMDLVGVKDLDDGKTYTKQEVLDYLKANQIQVRDVTFGATAVERRPGEEQVTVNDAPFAPYQLRGAKAGSYREVLLTVPEKQGPEIPEPQITGESFTNQNGGTDSRIYVNGEFYGVFGGDFNRARYFAERRWVNEHTPPSTTWHDGHSAYSSIPNPIVRIRFNERTTADGRRMLFIEEVQAPQKGQFERMPELFKKNWREIAFKWALRYAAENGFDAVGWTTGEQQAERYDLSKQIDRLQYAKGPEGIEIQAIKDQQTVLSKMVSQDDLEKTVGKEIAAKIQQGEGRKLRGADQWRELSGLDLKVGGEGLKKLYDVDFRNVVNNLPAVKKAGQKVASDQIRTGNERAPLPDIPLTDIQRKVLDYHGKWQRSVGVNTEWNASLDGQADAVVSAMQDGKTYNEAMQAHGSIALATLLNGGWASIPKNETIHSLSITPAIRESVMGGQPLFLSAATGVYPGSQPLSAREIDDFHHIVNGLAMQGVNTQIVKQLLDQFGNQLEGLYSNSRKLVVLAVRDVQNPTRKNLVAALHEAFHAVFANESDATKRRMEAAFAGLNRTFLTAPGVNVAQVNAEEALARVVADNLAEQGIQNPQTWAQRIIALLKELYLRVSLAIQQGLFGTQHTRQELAASYMQSRVSRFLAGHNLHPSFLEFIGGGKPRPAVQATYHSNANGGGWVNEYYNPFTGQLERPRVLEDSLAAVDYNHIPDLRYKEVELLTDPVKSSLDPAEIAISIATQNKLLEVFQKGYDEWTRLGHNGAQLPFDAWKESFLKIDPVKIITRQNAHMTANNLQPVNPGTSQADLPAETSVKRMSNDARLTLALQRTEWSTRRIAEELIVSQNAVALPRNITKLMDLLARWTSKDAMAKQTAEKTAEMVKEFKWDIRNIRKLSQKSGLLTQVISGIEENLDEPLMRQYEAAIERMFKRFVTDTKGERLVDLLETVSNLNIDWRNESAKDIRTKLEISAEINPKLAAFVGKDFDSRALFSIATAFAKSNASVVESLETKLAATEVERTAINQALKLAISDTADAIDKARTAITGKIPRLAVQAERLLMRLNEAKKENRKLIDESKLAREFIDFHQDTLPVMASEIAKLETKIGALSESWEAIDGAKLLVAPNTNATEDEVSKNFKILNLKKNGTTSADVRTWVESNEAWLAAKPVDERGAFWATFDRMTKKVELIDSKLEHELIIQPGFFNRVLGAIQDKLAYIGLPAARAASQRARQKMALKSHFTNPASEQGVKVDAARARAMNALGWTGTEEDFKRRFYNTIKGYFEKRKGDLARNADPALAVEQTWSATFAYLTANPEMAAMISKPGAWEALRNYIDLATANNKSIGKLKASQDFAGKVEDKEAGIFREPLGHPAYDTPRRVGLWMGSIVDGMRAAWGGTATLPLSKKAVADAHRQDPAALRQALAPRFTPEVWKGWIQWLAKRPGRSLFYAPEVGGVNPMARFTKEAFNAVPVGDVVSFAEELYKLEGGTSDLSEFVGETLSTIQAQTSALMSVFTEENQTSPHSAPVPARVIGDARRSEDFPSEVMDYQEFGSQEMRHMVELLSFEAAYGHNMVGIERDLTTAENQLNSQISEYENVKSDVAKRTLEVGKSQRVFRSELKKEVERRSGPGRLIQLENAARNLLTLQDQREQIHRLIEMQSGVPPELKSWFEMVGIGARMVVQRAGTALVDLVTPFEAPFRLMGISSPAFKHIFTSGKFGVSELSASLFQAFGKEFHMQAEQAKQFTELAMSDTDATMKVKDRFISAMRTPVNTSLTNPVLKAAETALVRTSRAIGAVLSTGIGHAKPGSMVHATTFAPWAVFTMENKIAHLSEALGTWRVFDDLVRKARDFYARNPAARADVAGHRFTAKELGYKNYFWDIINNEKAFKYMTDKLGDFGMNLEKLARNALANPNAQLFSAEQKKLLASLVRQEMTIESDESNLASGFFTNPVLSIARPLVGWGIGKTGAFAKSFHEPTGERNFNSVKAGLIATFLAAVPIGLAFAFLRDQWDEKVVGKKANVGQFGQGRDFAALIDKLARVGTFGEIASPVNALFNQDINRPFSVDSRVFFLNSLFNTVNALATWGRQGTATYATVYRPLASALGGGGFLDTIDILNNLTGADNMESRVIARINVNNYLRSVGRELGLDVMRSSGGPALSTTIKPHISNMLLAALANDYTAFKDAYDKAIEAAREEGKPDPEDYVKRSFAAHHPLRTVFRTPPSELEYQGILASLNPRGQRDVSEAVDLFNRYGEVLGIKEFDGREEKPQSKTKASGVTSAEARARAAFGLRENIFAR